MGKGLEKPLAVWKGGGDGCPDTVDECITQLPKWFIDSFPSTAGCHIRSDQISRSVMSDSLRPHESQHARPPCPSPTPGVHSDSHDHMTTGKTIALTRRTFVAKVISLLFNMLSRLIITYLPRSKHVLISWLQSPSSVILEPQKIKSDTVSTVSPSISHEVMGP